MNKRTLVKILGGALAGFGVKRLAAAPTAIHGTQLFMPPGLTGTAWNAFNGSTQELLFVGDTLRVDRKQNPARLELGVEPSKLPGLKPATIKKLVYDPISQSFDAGQPIKMHQLFCNGLLLENAADGDYTVTGNKINVLPNALALKETDSKTIIYLWE